MRSKYRSSGANTTSTMLNIGPAKYGSCSNASSSFSSRARKAARLASAVARSLALRNCQASARIAVPYSIQARAAARATAHPQRRAWRQLASLRGIRQSPCFRTAWRPGHPSALSSARAPCLSVNAPDVVLHLTVRFRISSFNKIARHLI